MYRNFVYDFDGTLSDTYPIFTETLMEVLHRHGLSDSYENVYALLKISVGAAIKHYDWGVDWRVIDREFHGLHEVLAMQKQKPIPGAEEILRAAVACGKKNFLYTHTDKLAYRLLEKWGLGGYFTDAIDGSMSFPRKPAPDALLHLMEKNALEPTQTLMVGDRDIDIDVGHNAGCDGCLYDPEAFYTSVKSEHSIKTLTELLPYIEA